MSLNDVVNEVIELKGGTDLVLFERVVLGFTVSLGYVLIGNVRASACDAVNASCSGLNWLLTAGFQAEVLILPPSAPMTPWVGVGVSIEDLLLTEKIDSTQINSSFGASTVDVKAGLDFRVKASSAAWGPFVTYRFGQYTSLGQSFGSNDVSNTDTVKNPSDHGWLMIGLRARF